MSLVELKLSTIQRKAENYEVRTPKGSPQEKGNIIHAQNKNWQIFGLLISAKKHKGCDIHCYLKRKVKKFGLPSLEILTISISDDKFLEMRKAM